MNLSPQDYPDGFAGSGKWLKLHRELSGKIDKPLTAMFDISLNFITQVTKHRMSIYS